MDYTRYCLTMIEEVGIRAFLGLCDERPDTAYATVTYRAELAQSTEES